MKPFNLSQALAGRPVVIRDGRKVTWIAHDPGAHADARIIARIEGNPYHSVWNEQGRFARGCNLAMQLFMAPIKRHGWVNVLYNGANTYCNCVIYDTKELAEGVTYSNGLEKLATIPIEWEE